MNHTSDTARSEFLTSMALTTAYEMRRKRREIAEHPSRRQEATSGFVCSVSRAAIDLRELCRMRRDGEKLSPEAEDAARYLEDIIRAAYREAFGAELGN